MKRPFLMGILNVTPDSFSDGGLYCDVDSATAHALKMVDAGADIIDIGGESTRPGSESVSESEELERVIPVIKSIRAQSDIPISIDTQKSHVAFEAMQAGAQWINDISAARSDPEMAAVMAESKASVVIMHMRGTPSTMQNQTEYTDLISEIRDFLEERAGSLQSAGVQEIIIDPGLGFAKTAEQNLQILRGLKDLRELGRPILIGASRKSFIQKILGAEASNTLEGSLAVAAYAILQGCAGLRVHDLAATARLRKVLAALEPETV